MLIPCWATEVSPEAAIALLEEAAVKRNIPTERLVQAFKILEKAKLPVSLGATTLKFYLEYCISLRLLA